MHLLTLAQHWFAHHTGMDKTAGPSVYYNSWSGFISDLGLFAVVGGLVQLARHHNCGVKGCWRFHRYEYEMDGVTHKVCRHHHPKLGKDFRLHHHHLLDHADARVTA
jgi:hypothetical protein